MFHFSVPLKSFFFFFRTTGGNFREKVVRNSLIASGSALRKQQFCFGRAFAFMVFLFCPVPECNVLFSVFSLGAEHEDGILARR